MMNTGWIIASIGTAAIVAALCIITIVRMLHGKRTGFPRHEVRPFSHEPTTLGSSLIVLGIVSGTDRLISYSFIGAGVLLSIISVILSKREVEK